MAEDHLATGGRPEEDLSVDEDLAGLAEVAPIKLTTPASQGIGADQAEKTTAETPAKKKYCFIATAAYGSPSPRKWCCCKPSGTDTSVGIPWVRNSSGPIIASVPI